LGEVERGIKAPSLKVFIAIADALGVSTDSLLRDSISSANVYVNNGYRLREPNEENPS